MKKVKDEFKPIKCPYATGIVWCERKLRFGKTACDSCEVVFPIKEDKNAKRNRV